MNYDLGEQISLPVIDISFLINQNNDLHVSTHRKGALIAKWIGDKDGFWHICWKNEV